MTIRLYFDEDTMDKALVLALRARGAEVLTAQEAGMSQVFNSLRASRRIIILI